jgi:hypothetical protein
MNAGRSIQYSEYAGIKFEFCLPPVAAVTDKHNNIRRPTAMSLFQMNEGFAVRLRKAVDNRNDS